jgi:ribosomal protein L11 methyltransferase
VALYAALHITGVDDDLALAAADDWRPVAAEGSAGGLMIYFASRDDRDAAVRGLADTFPDALVASTDVDDGDWARRSQENLGPIVVGRITVRPGNSDRPDAASTSRPGAPGPIDLVIQPSMGFGTGHHATTRLCLAALQRIEVTGQVALDVGTGSGVLALAARALGAARAIGIDHDPDAIQSARENLPLNPCLDGVTFEQSDLTRDALPQADIVTANLTGALLCRTAATLVSAVRRSGTLVLSGILAAEREAVMRAFSGLTLSWEAQEEEWVALMFHRPGPDKI